MLWYKLVPSTEVCHIVESLTTFFRLHFRNLLAHNVAENKLKPEYENQNKSNSYPDQVA